MTIDPDVRYRAEELLDYLRDASDESEALDVLITSELEDLPVVAAAALVILATESRNQT